MKVYCLLQVFQFFGYRPRNIFGGRLFDRGESLNLIQWYDKELNNKEEFINMYNVWKETGLFEQFSEKLVKYFN
jgi:hypothetical protein